MKIRDLLIFWMGLLVMLVLLSGIRSLLALHDVHLREDHIREDYEVAITARKLRYLLTGFDNYGVHFEVDPSAENRQKRDEYRNELRHQLEQGLGKGVEPFLEENFEILHGKILRLLEFNKGFLRPLYRDRYNEVLAASERLALDSLQVVTLENAEDEGFFRYHFRLSVAILVISLGLILMILLLMNRRIFRPMKALIGLLQQIRAGDLSAKWRGNDVDEIGELGVTLTGLTQELENRRKERVEFVASVSHDLKSPLSAIGLTCDLALRDSSRLAPEKASVLFVMIKAQVDRMSRLADDLSEAIKGNRPFRSVQRTRFALDQLARNALETFQSSDRGHTYQLLVESVLAPIWADQDRISQVFTNLLSNAAKYSPQGSLIEVWLGKAEGFVCFEIRDRGVGIPEEKKERVFEAYIRLDAGKRLSEGTGLGLAIVKDIVDSHGGTITILDRPEGGAVFRVCLPEG